MPDQEKPPTPPQETASPPAEPWVPCAPVPEVQEGLHTRFARLFFGVITLLVLYYSYLIIKPYLLDIFMALVLFFTAKPLYMALNRLLPGQQGPGVRSHLPHPAPDHSDPAVHPDEHHRQPGPGVLQPGDQGYADRPDLAVGRRSRSTPLRTI